MATEVEKVPVESVRVTREWLQRLYAISVKFIELRETLDYERFSTGRKAEVNPESKSLRRQLRELTEEILSSVNKLCGTDCLPTLGCFWNFEEIRTFRSSWHKFARDWTPINAEEAWYSPDELIIKCPARIRSVLREINGHLKILIGPRTNMTIVCLDVTRSTNSTGFDPELFYGILQPILSYWEAIHPNTWGDALVAAFESPESAAHCALKSRDALASQAIAVRIGMSWGNDLNVIENEVRGTSDFTGTCVAWAARLEEIAMPGEVLINTDLKERLDCVKGFSTTPQVRSLKKALGSLAKAAPVDCFLLSY